MIRDQIIDTILAQVREPDGMNAAALNFSRATKYIYTKQLQDEGRIFKARKANVVRYFDTMERGLAWEQAQPNKPSIYSAHKKPKVGWGPSDPVVITSETRVTIAPTPAAPTRTNTYSPWG